MVFGIWNSYDRTRARINARALVYEETLKEQAKRQIHLDFRMHHADVIIHYMNKRIISYAPYPRYASNPIRNILQYIHPSPKSLSIPFFLSTMLSHNLDKHLIHRRLSDRVILDPQRTLVVIQQPEEMTDSFPASCRRRCIIPSLIARDPRLVGRRHSEPNLSAVRLLLNLDPLDIPHQPGFQHLHLPETGVRGAGSHELHVVDVAPSVTEIVDRADGQHTTGHDPGAVGERVGFLHAVGRQDDTAAGRELRKGVPHDAFRGCVETGGRFV